MSLYFYYNQSRNYKISLRKIANRAGKMGYFAKLHSF